MLWSILVLLVLDNNGLFAQSCGVSVNLIPVGKDTIMAQMGPVERCIYRVDLLCQRNDVAKVSIVPVVSQSAVWFADTVGGGSVTWAISSCCEPRVMFLPFTGKYPGTSLPFPYTIGRVWISGSAPQPVTIYFENPNGQLICSQQVVGQCGSQGGTPQSGGCLVQTITVSTGYDPVTGSTIPIGSYDPNWIVVSDPIAGTNEPRPSSVINLCPISGAWSSPILGSQWIAVYNSPSNSTNGVYVFKRCFCIEGPTTATAVVDLKVLADDVVDSIVVCGRKLTNRTQNYTHNWFVSPPREYRDTLQLPGGSCCIEVYVRNTHNMCFGLDISGSIQQLPTLAPTLLADTCCSESKCWIIGQKFHDLNCNGEIDQGEPPLSGWQINVVSGSNTYSATTGSDGWYNIQVPPGTYTINEVPKPGYQQSAGGPFVVTLTQGQVVQYDFLNCTAPPPCDTLGTPRLDSSCCQFTIPIFLAQGSGIPGVSSISWSLAGGTMESITPLLGCPGTLTPPNPYGTTSGTITFSPPCTVNPLNLMMEVSPTTASGAVTLYLAINHGPDKVCYDTVTLRCTRAPITRCDSLSVAPFNYVNLQLSGRTFTIFNLKQPASPIQEVHISFSPTPPCSSSATPNGDWNGGQLVVDGSSRVWGVANSGNPKYSLVSMACPPSTSAPQGLAASNKVQFNLGIDITCGWTGDVVLKVIHCDGDTCTLTYPNWCAKPPKQCLIIDPFDPIGLPIPTGRALAVARVLEVVIDTALVPGTPELHACNATVVPTSPEWEVIGISVEDELTREERESGRYLLWGSGAKLTKADAARTGFVELLPCKQDPLPPVKQPWILRAILGTRNPELQRDTPTVQITFYDANANPIALAEAKATMKVDISSTPEEIRQPLGSSSQILDVVPNPAQGDVRIVYYLTQPTDGTLEVCDLLGRCLLRIHLPIREEGKHSMLINLDNLPVGSYTVLLRTSIGISTKQLVIVR